MSAYVPPHKRGKPQASSASNDSAAPAQGLGRLSLGGGGGGGRWDAPQDRPGRGRNDGGRWDAPRDRPDRGRYGAGAANASRYGRYGAGGAAAPRGELPPNPYENPPDQNTERDRYVSAYDAAQQDHYGESVEGVEDDRAQFAKLIGFSRHRREKLGHRRVTGDDSGRRKRQSAPRAFGTNDHGRGLEFGEDLKGGTRVDEEDGMVYEMDDGSGVFFCDRFRRYKFFCGACGLGLLKELVGVNAILLKRNKELFEGDKDCLLYTSPSPRDRG